MSRRYITTPIYYVNAPPHLGHAYTTVVADTYARYRRLAGDRVRFQTGTDEHGDKIAQAAATTGITPAAYADRISALFRGTWPLLGIEADDFIRTTEERHVRVVQQILQEVFDRGDIYFSSYTGLYCRGCERFLIDRELADGLCPDHREAPREVSEENYFFRMGRYQEWLIAHIESHADCISPERYRNEVLSFLREPLEDLCISRPKSRLEWGIPLPFDDRFVTYVWFDALINYISGAGYPDDPDFPGWWKEAEHVIAKDILKPHAVYWPTMLRAIGLEPFRRLHVHGYWNIGAGKMSKSLGNVVRPADLVGAYGADALRFCLLREMTFGLDAAFSADILEARYNADLANDLGNLFSRCHAMIGKYLGGVVAAPPAALANGDDTGLRDAALRMVATYRQEMEAFAFHRALAAVWEVVGLANRYIVTNAPWELVKSEEGRERVRVVLAMLAELLRLFAVLLTPVMPDTARRMLESLGLEDWWRTTERRLDLLCCWGIIPAATKIKEGLTLFPRLETGEKKQEKGDRRQGKQMEGKNTQEENAAPAYAGIDDFCKIELRVAEIVAAEAVPKSNKLLRLLVRAPEERVIVAGIGRHFRPEELPGRKVVIVANLKPAKLMGVESHGMVLAAKTGEGEQEVLSLLSPGVDMPAGSRIS